MDSVDLIAGVGKALDSVLANRLAILCGAGLSMAPPSSIPSAASIAQAAKLKYDATYGATRPPLPVSIDDQAEFFFANGELASYYLSTLVDRDSFASRPNAGHLATADLLLTRGIVTAVTTNVDQLVEFAGNQLFGNVDRGTTQQEVAAIPPNRSPMLKIHGCWSRPDETIWAVGQLSKDPVMTRIAECATWLNTQLLNRDLIVVGFWTDWDYLNDVLEQSIGKVNPARVIVVDPSPSTVLETKAPALYKLGLKATEFLHVQESGATFLEQLRIEFSRSFLRRVLNSGAADFVTLKGTAPGAALTEPYSDSAEALWRIRRDLEGARPNAPAKLREPPAGETNLGLTLLQLRARGATADDSCWMLDGKRIRVLRAPNMPLYAVEAAYSRDTAPLVAPDHVIAVGAEPIELPTSIARGSPTGSIARGAASKWLSRQEAVAEFNL